MAEVMKPHKELIDTILDIELEMFLAVNSKEPASCQEHPDRFRLMRGSQFYAWSVGTLESYLADLKLAVAEGNNIMTLKYARMDDLIPELNHHPLIDALVKFQLDWQKELAADYPKIVGRGRALDESTESLGGASFASYLRGELETYSSKTLESLYEDIKTHSDNGRNMAKIVYERMVVDLGYSSLDEAEASIGVRG